MGMAVLVHKEAAFQPAPDVGQELGIHVAQVAPEGFPAVDVDLEGEESALRGAEPESHGMQVADLLFELVKRLLYGLWKECGRHGNRDLVRAVCLYGFDGSFIGGRHGGRQLMRIG